MLPTKVVRDIQTILDQQLQLITMFILEHHNPTHKCTMEEGMSHMYVLQHEFPRAK